MARPESFLTTSYRSCILASNKTGKRARQIDFQRAWPRMTVNQLHRSTINWNFSCSARSTTQWSLKGSGVGGLPAAQASFPCPHGAPRFTHSVSVGDVVTGQFWPWRHHHWRFHQAAIPTDGMNQYALLRPKRDDQPGPDRLPRVDPFRVQKDRSLACIWSMCDKEYSVRRELALHVRQRTRPLSIPYAAPYNVRQEAGRRPNTPEERVKLYHLEPWNRKSFICNYTLFVISTEAKTENPRQARSLLEWK